MKRWFEKVRPVLLTFGGRVLFPLLLVLWPFAGLHRGVDVADTTYALTNYTWLGEMDPMWLLATWLPNVLGRLFTRLPGGDTLYGMKVYCTLLVPLTALIVYVALGRIAGKRFPAWLRFLSLWIAESLCWCPTVILYNYLSYLFFTCACVCILAAYAAPVCEEAVSSGKTGNVTGSDSTADGASGRGGRTISRRARRLLLAGVFLGVNLFVRFPNIVEVLLIIAVWFFAVVTAPRRTASPATDSAPAANGASTGGSAPAAGSVPAADGSTAAGSTAAAGRPAPRPLWLNAILSCTGWCILGYIAGVIIPFVIICILYSPSAWFGMIGDLFSMTEGAADYGAAGMLGMILEAYGTTLKELVPAVLAILASALCFLAAAKWSPVRPVAILLSGFLFALLIRLYYGVGVFTRNYWYYDSMFEPAMMVIILILAVGILAAAGLTTKDPLLRGAGVLVVLVILITPLGSNNYTYPVVNNLFVVLPVGAVLLLEALKKLSGNSGITFVRLPAESASKQSDHSGQNDAAGRTSAKDKPFLAALGLPCSVFALILVLLLLVQGSFFHMGFAFGDGRGGRRLDTKLSAIPRTAGMVTTRDNAVALKTLYDGIRALETSGGAGTEAGTNVASSSVASAGTDAAASDGTRSAIIFGGAPGLHYLLDVKPALFTAWPDLDSNAEARVKQALEEMPDDQRPVVILRGNKANSGSPWSFGTQGKARAILDYLSKKGYNELFRVDADDGVFYVVYD